MLRCFSRLWIIRIIISAVTVHAVSMTLGSWTRTGIVVTLIPVVGIPTSKRRSIGIFVELMCNARIAGCMPRRIHFIWMIETISAVGRISRTATGPHRMMEWTWPRSWPWSSSAESSSATTGKSRRRTLPSKLIFLRRIIVHVDIILVGNDAVSQLGIGRHRPRWARRKSIPAQIGSTVPIPVVVPMRSVSRVPISPGWPMCHIVVGATSIKVSHGRWSVSQGHDIPVNGSLHSRQWRFAQVAQHGIRTICKRRYVLHSSIIIAMIVVVVVVVDVASDDDAEMLSFSQ
mmetsp:Transcript_5072/g.10110  ORF Transcript_5072/g.10110 Transcript_5072/m.10110 type:complete len:288 (-) Transcript_5072:497-1360(-)